MTIKDFVKGDLQEATELARMNYEKECEFLGGLPKAMELPDLTYFAENNLGVTAWDGSRMIGFLGTYRPVSDAFGTTNVKGCFTPIEAHGALHGEFGISNYYNRDRIYSRLYQAAADKWVRAGIRSHAIALYADDKEAINSFFYNGFGMRCIDAIISLKDDLEEKNIGLVEQSDLKYYEMPKEEWGELTDVHNDLISHLGASPSFMRIPQISREELYQRAGEDVRYFGVKYQGSYIAYLKVSDSGENFITEHPLMMNICGAFCKPDYRGTNIIHNLLRMLIITLRNEGYLYLGVDCESFNPNARGFWMKYFNPYTYSLVRRIDEKAVDYYEIKTS